MCAKTKEREREDGKGNEPRGKRRDKSLLAPRGKIYAVRERLLCVLLARKRAPCSEWGTIVSSGRGNSRFSRTRNLGGIRLFICRSSSNKIKQNASRVFHAVFLPDVIFFFFSCVDRRFATREQVYIYAFYCTVHVIKNIVRCSHDAIMDIH